MKVQKITSAVVGVGSSRRKNTIAREELKFVVLNSLTQCEPQRATQPYPTKPPYQYESKPMSQDRSLGAIWYNRKRTTHLM